MTNCHLLSFTRAMKAKKKHKDDSSMSSSLCLKQTKIGGRGKENDDQRLLSSFVFHRNDKG
jgi:hypothetical protein